MTKSTSKKRNSSQDDLPKRCAFAFSDGRRCRMPRWKGSRQFCLFHGRQEQQLLHVDYMGKKHPTLSTWFQTATDLNYALGNLFEAVARNRVPPRHAAVLAYISQLLIQTLPQVKAEAIRIEGQESWDENVKRTLDAQYGDEPEQDAESGSESQENSAPVDPAPPADRSAAQ
jgi:hypothetical protein